MRVARTWRLSLLSVAAVLTAQLTPLAAAHAGVMPTAVVNTAPGTHEEGIGTIDGTGTVDPAVTATSLQLLVDGTLVDSPQPCPAAMGAACSLTLTHDFTGLSGSHLVAIELVSNDGANPVVDSPAVGMNTASVPPTVAVTSPSSGATVTGLTTIASTGSVDVKQTDWPTSLSLYVNGTLFQTHACTSPPARTCSTTWSYDFTGLSGSQQLVVHMATSRIAETDSAAPYAVNVSNPAPVVTITSPSSGSFQSGTVAIDSTATVNSSLSDYAKTLQLFADGVSYGPAFTCPATVKICSHTFSWDGTGRTDSAPIFVRLVTTNLVTADSATIGLNMTTPPPSVSITNPANGTPQQGVVSVDTTAAVGPGQTDTAKSVQLLLDGVTLLGSPTLCPATATCTKTITWDASGVTGSHSLAVKFVTTNLKTVTSSAISFLVSSPGPTALVQSPTFGTTVTGSNVVTGLGAIAAGQTDTPSTLQLYVDGAAVGSPVACGSDGNARHCPDSFIWDATGLVGYHSVQVKFVTTAPMSVLSPSVVVNVASPPPVVAVTSPTASATVAGTVSVSATATVDASQTDSISSLQLYVDGAASGSAVSCPGSSKVCSTALSWDATGLSGSHVVQTMAVTARSVSTLSPGVSVTVANPAPRVTITSPTVGSVVSDVATITATGQVDASQTDSASSMMLMVDGKQLGYAQTCPTGADAKACSESFSWATSGLTGAHTIAVSLTSSRGSTGVTSEKVYVFSGTSIKLTKSAPIAYGHVATVKGTVLATGNGKGASAGLVVDVTFTPAVGTKHTLAVHTDSLGRFAATFKVPANTAVSAVLVNPVYYGPSSAKSAVAVTAGVSCPAKVTVNHGVLVKGVCKVPNLAKGVKVSLQYKVGSHWVNVGSAKAGKAVVAYSARFAKAGTYSVRLAIGSSRIFAAGFSAASKWVVR